MKKILLLATMVLLSATTALASKAPFTKDTTLTRKEKKDRLFTPAIMMKMGRLSNTQLSPNAKQILYTVNFQSVRENRSYTALWVAGKDGSNPVQITKYDISVTQPRWNHNGSQIYFLSGGDVYSITPEGKDQKRLTSTKGKVTGFGVSPDDQKIWVSQFVKVQDVLSSERYKDFGKSQGRIYDDLMARHWDAWDNGEYSHVFVAEASKNGRFGKFRDIMEGERFDAPGSPYFSIAEISWSADSRYVAYTCRKLNGYQYAISTNTDIYRYDTDTRRTENLTEGMPGYDKYPVFSPCGRYMAWQSMERAGNESDLGRLMVLDFNDRSVRYLTQGFDYSASNMVWDSSSSGVYFISAINGCHQVCYVMLDKPEVQVLTSGLQDFVSLSVVGRDIVCERSTLSMAPEAFHVNMVSGDIKQLTFINQAIYDNVDMGHVEERWVPTTDGKKMLTWVVTPPNANLSGRTKYPALLYCQGGPQSVVSQFWSYRWNFQVMAAQGYVVVAPNRRGVPSFGSEWLDQISGDYSGQNIEDYLSAIDHVADEKYVDKKRLGAVGASYGGYSVFYLAGNHDGRFRSFISHCGIFNFESMYGSTEELWFVNRDYGGPYWDKRNSVAQRSYANSPHKFVEKWDTPMLVIAGLKDYRVPYAQSLEAFTAARARGLDSRLLVFEDEAHQVFKPQNAMVWYSEFLGWLDTYLKK